MKQIALILSNQATFSNRVALLWKQCFPNIELRTFAWILKNPDITSLLESANITISLIIIDDVFVSNILNQNGADHLFKKILQKTPQVKLVYAFEKNWLNFFKQYPKALCIGMSCDDPQDLLIVHISRLLREKPSETPELKIIDDTTQVKPVIQQKTIMEKPQELELIERNPIDIKKLIKSSLYALLNQIEKQNVQLKISLPEYPITVIENRDALISFFNEHIKYLLSQIGGVGYSFIQVNVTSAYKQCIIKILHSKILDKQLDCNKSLNVITNESSTQIILNTPENETPQSSDAIRSSKQPKVLIVEDEILMLEMIVTTLESEAFIVEGFSNSIQAAKAINQSKYDLILTDINIPNFSGFQVINTIRESAHNKDTKIVAMTGLQNEYTIQSIKELNLDGFLSKPFSLEKLSQLLKRILHDQD
ncbi:response regulator [bacterium]|nr:response regulator [bacterium]